MVKTSVVLTIKPARRRGSTDDTLKQDSLNNFGVQVAAFFIDLPRFMCSSFLAPLM